MTDARFRLAAPVRAAPASGRPHLGVMLKRFLLYGCAGWIAEVLFTGAASAALERDPNATSKTYLWMHPIYGVAGLAIEATARWLGARKVPRPVRALAYVPLMYAAEYASGWLLCRVLGKCPWDYGQRGINTHGLVRWDYAPAWYAAGLAFEPVADAVVELTRPKPRLALPWR